MGRLCVRGRIRVTTEHLRVRIGKFLAHFLKF